MEIIPLIFMIIVQPVMQLARCTLMQVITAFQVAPLKNILFKTDYHTASTVPLFLMESTW